MAEMHKTYASAIFELACDEHIEDKVLDDIKDLNLLLYENPEYITLLDSPAIDKREKEKIINEALGNFYPDILILFFKHLCKKGLATQFNLIAKEYEIIYSELQKLSRITIKSAIELNDSEKKKILIKFENITKRKIIPEYVIDKSLLGGVVVETEGRIYDGSLLKKINELKKVMKE